MTVPKITHQIWFQGWENLPEKYNENVLLLRCLNPDWEHLPWDETRLRKECEKLGSDYVAKFDSFTEMIHKIDFGRYVVLYNFGGVSIDVDTKPLRSLDKIPGIDRYDFTVSKWALGELEGLTVSRGMSEGLTMFNNAFFACSPKTYIMLDFINYVTKTSLSDPHDLEFDTQIKTGPIILSHFLNSHYIDEINILDNEIVEPWGHVTKRTVLNHLYDGSWWDPVNSRFKGPYSWIRNNLTFIVLCTLAVLQTIKLARLLKQFS